MTDGDELYVWQEFVSDEQAWGSVWAFIPAANVAGNLVTRSYTIATSEFRVLAEGHRKGSGNPVRLARFEMTMVMAEVI